MHKNAFELMMASQRQRSLKTMPDLIEQPRTGKQRLRNSIITFLREKKCQWRGTDEVTSQGQSFISALTDALWTVDGHHHVFSNQSVVIPSIFLNFVGYNRPELSKHRKRTVSNISGSVLRSVSSHLLHCLQASYWNRQHWVQLKNDVEQFALALGGYAGYLEKSLKKTKLNHSLSSPVREISNNISFQFLPLCDSTTAPVCAALCRRLGNEPNYHHVSVEEFSPTECRAKYNFLQIMKRVGITFPTALLTYTHGNNVGSLHFVWRVETFGDGAFSDSQPVIELIKKDIPVYHTRMMRKEMFKVFGRLTSSLKPAFARYIYRVFTGMAVHQYVSCRFKVHFLLLHVLFLSNKCIFFISTEY